MTILHTLMQAVAIATLVLFALGAWALWVTRNHRYDDQQDVSRLDRYDGIGSHLTEWDLDRDTHDPADLCEAYPWECDWDDVPCCHGCATDLGPCYGPGYQHICLTHHREGADQ